MEKHLRLEPPHPMLSRAIPLPVPASPGPAKSRVGAREEVERHLAAHLWSSMGHWSTGWTDGIGLTLAVWQLLIFPPPGLRVCIQIQLLLLPSTGLWCLPKSSILRASWSGCVSGQCGRLCLYGRSPFHRSFSLKRYTTYTVCKTSF